MAADVKDSELKVAEDVKDSELKVAEDVKGSELKVAEDVKDEKEVLYFPGVDDGEWCEKIFYKQDEIQSVKTGDFYKIDKKLPYRFKYPYALNTYGCQGEPETIDSHYRTTSSDYGYYRPTVHTVSTKYFPKNASFTKFMTGRRSRSTRLNA